MTKTDKDDPFWVKARSYPDDYEARHRHDCVNNIHSPGDFVCDLPEGPPIEKPVNASFCYWCFLPDDHAKYVEVFGTFPASGCDNPRCTNCKQKKHLKRKRRRQEERDLVRDIEEMT